MSFFKRTISLLLALCMIGTVLTFSAFANQEDDYSCVHVMGEDGNCTECGETLVAVNDKGDYFSSLQRAIDASGNIRLLQTVVSDDNTAVTVRTGNSVTLDLNGKKLGGDEDGSLLSINNYGSFTLTDSSENKGELHGGIYTKGYEIRDPETDEVTEFAYGASTVILGGRIYGDVTAEHDEGRGYFASEVKPNPAVTVNGGYFIGGHISVPDNTRGIFRINAGCFTVEPPHKFIKSGFEAEYDGRYYCIVAARYFAGLKESLLLASDLSGRARTVALSNSAVSDFITDDLLDVSEIMRQNAIVFDESTSLRSALFINAVSADVHGDGESAIVTGMKFAVSPLLYVYRGGECLELPGDWGSITTDNSDGGITVRFPVDSRLTCGSVSFNTCSRTVNLDVLSKNGEKYIQVFVSEYELASGVSYSAVIKEDCSVTYNGCGGICSADGTELPYETLSIKGTDDLVLKSNIFEREHYSFIGWDCNGVVYEPGDIYPFVVGDMAFDAVWGPDRYSITYILNGGENSNMNIPAYDYATAVTLYNPHRDGAVFGGWYEDEDFSGEPVSEIAYGDFGNRTFYAKWNVEVKFDISGNGSGIVSGIEGVIENGTVVSIPEGSDFRADIFVRDGSFIESVSVNGETVESKSLLSFENIDRNLFIEVIFSDVSDIIGGSVDFSEARAEDGGKLDSSLLGRAEKAFENSNVVDFENAGLREAIDMSTAKTVFSFENGKEVSDRDTVLFSLRMEVETIYENNGYISGYTVDIKPVMTVVSAEGGIKGTCVVPNEAVVSAVSFRIPVDMLAYMDDAIVSHEGDFLGYIKIQGTSPDRYVEVVTDSFSPFTIKLVTGNTNHPGAAIESFGYTTFSEAYNHAKSGDAIYVLKEDTSLAGFYVVLNDGTSVVLSAALADAGQYEPVKLAEKDVFVMKAYDVAPGEIVAAGSDISIKYESNNGSSISQCYTHKSEEEYIIIDNPFTPVAGARFSYWNTNKTGNGERYYPGDKVLFNSDITLYAVWNGFVAEVVHADGRAPEKFYSLAEAQENADERDSIVLISDVEENVEFSKELIFDLNGHKFLGSTGFSVLTPFKGIAFGDGSKYQIRRPYIITYHMGTSLSATEKNDSRNPVYSYFDSDVILYRPTKTRSGSDKIESATFAGWYYDSEWNKPTFAYEVSRTKVGYGLGRIPKTAAPAWPSDIDLYPRWMWTISAYNNNYGYIECDGIRIPSGTRFYFDEGMKPEYTFVPYDGYNVYRATIKDYKTTKEKARYSYIPEYWDRNEGEEYYHDCGLQVNTIIVVTFARGYYNPLTGDDSSIRIWICLMCASLVMLSGAAVVSRRRKKR